MAWIETFSDGEARGPLEKSYASARARAGRVYGIVRVMGQSPRVLDASMAFYGAIMFAPRGLRRDQREMLAVVVSRANDCHY